MKSLKIIGRNYGYFLFFMFIIFQSLGKAQSNISSINPQNDFKRNALGIQMSPFAKLLHIQKTAYLPDDIKTSVRKKLALLYERKISAHHAFFVNLNLDWNNTASDLVRNTDQVIHDTVSVYTDQFLIFFKSSTKVPKSSDFYIEKLYLKQNVNCEFIHKFIFGSGFWKVNILSGIQLGQIKYLRYKREFIGSINSFSTGGQFSNYFIPWWLLSSSTDYYAINGNLVHSYVENTATYAYLLSGLSISCHFRRIPVQVEFGLQMYGRIGINYEIKNLMRKVNAKPELRISYMF